MPAGTAMSTPACSRPQRMPNGDTTGPLTGQIIPPEPGLIGPAAPGAVPFGAAGELGLDLRVLLLQRREVALEVLAVLARADERGRLRRAHAGERVAAVDELALDAGDGVAALLDRRGHLRLALLERVEPRLGALGVGARGADAVDDARVLVGDALHELGALEHVGEAV